MLVTEKEARTKWCPDARVGLTAGMAVNRHPDDSVNEDCCCAGSACMAWRWWGLFINEADQIPTRSYPGERIDPSSAPRRVGYCGRAGQL